MTGELTLRGLVLPVRGGKVLVMGIHSIFYSLNPSDHISRLHDQNTSHANCPFVLYICGGALRQGRNIRHEMC
jgi:hypothetical protein